jgi:hypothetical protein
MIDGDPLAYVLSKNLKRRHLTKASAHGGGAAGQPDAGRPAPERRQIWGFKLRRSRGQAAERGESARSSGPRLSAHGAPEIVEAVDEGRIAVSAAAEIAAQPAERQAEILAACRAMPTAS